MATIRILLLSSLFSLFSLSIIANNSQQDYLHNWQVTYVSTMSPQELQLTANFLYLSYAVALAELKVRQFSTPLSRLHQSIRTKVTTYQNCSDDLAMLKTLLDRLSYVNGARIIYIEMLNVCTQYYNQHTTEKINAALTSIQLDAQATLQQWANNRTNQTGIQLKKFSETIATNLPQLHGAAELQQMMSKGTLPIEITKENEANKSIMVIDTILKSNHKLLDIIDDIVDTLNETTDYAEQIIWAGSEIYKNYYVTIHNIITSPAFNKKYATNMFSMHDLLPEEYKTVLPEAHRVFEHMLQTTKLYTQSEVLQK